MLFAPGPCGHIKQVKLIKRSIVGVGVMKIKEYGLYNVYVDGEIILHEIFGYEVKEEVAFLKKMYAEGCGGPRKIEVRESE